MKYHIELRIIAMQSKIVFHSYQFFYEVCERLSKKHSEIVDRGCKLISEHSKGE